MLAAKQAARGRTRDRASEAGREAGSTRLPAPDRNLEQAAGALGRSGHPQRTDGALRLWTCSSAARLATELTAVGHAVSERTVNRLWHVLGYSLQANRKTLEQTVYFGETPEGPARTSERLAGAECLTALAHATWAAAHAGAECPSDHIHIPTPHDMAAWWPWPEALVEDLAAWLTERAGPYPLTFEAVAPELETRIGRPAYGRERDGAAETTSRRRPGSAAPGDALWPAAAPRGDGGRRAHRHDPPVGYRSGAADRRTGSVGRFIEHPSPARSPGRCLATGTSGQVGHETRADRRIMPTLRVVGPTPERERGILFGGLFGDQDAKHRTRASILAPWQDLPDLTMEEATEARTGVRGWRLLPTDRPQQLALKN